MQDEEEQMIAENITENGGEVVPAVSEACTHLVLGTLAGADFRYLAVCMNMYVYVYTRRARTLFWEP